ncbi:hypothetical protein B0T26DRAFT_812820 [Lasiosphaeria miniovina]|uniref:Rhodopsin domain-containing protein n=1 Tax=Lasiosphaeria miniovina TaxID=1954250 RepID=A0AA40AMA2_9PEZI|nr:uncharacterized protein B0T26DRAFT_812820 [Lasiosphaeria miniovina]KAK0718466.1 hypothetical protein B0T26DRAFT_812820 [Lasiosphaeria miniovina]
MTSSGAWGVAPPGVDLSETQDADIIGSVVAIMVIGLVSVILRLFTRLMERGPGLALDDYVILFAAVMGVGTAACCLASVPWGGGKHLWVVTHEEFTKLYQTTYAFVIVYITCISATKISILLFYRRIFSTNVAWYVVLGLTVAHWAEVTITWLAGCQPREYYWRQYTDPTATGRCIDAPLFYFCNGIIGLVIDVAILLVPIPTTELAHVQEGAGRWNPAARRLVRSLLPRSLSPPPFFVCVASAVRIVMMDQLVKSADFTWAMSKVFIWSCCEPFVGIVCACLPTYAPLFRRLWRRDTTYGSDGPSSYVPGQTWSAKRADWSMSRKHKLGGAMLYGDDEVELTVDISGQTQTQGSSRVSSKGKASSQEQIEFESNEIMVRKDFSWSSSA